MEGPSKLSRHGEGFEGPPDLAPLFRTVKPDSGKCFIARKGREASTFSGSERKSKTAKLHTLSVRSGIVKPKSRPAPSELTRGRGIDAWRRGLRHGDIEP